MCVCVYIPIRQATPLDPRRPPICVAAEDGLNPSLSLSIYISMYICIYVYIYIYKYIYMYMYIYKHTHTHTHMYTYMYIHIYTNAHTYGCITCRWICIFIFMSTHSYLLHTVAEYLSGSTL